MRKTLLISICLPSMHLDCEDRYTVLYHLGLLPFVEPPDAIFGVIVSKAR